MSPVDLPTWQLFYLEMLKVNGKAFEIDGVQEQSSQAQEGIHGCFFLEKAQLNHCFVQPVTMCRKGLGWEWLICDVTPRDSVPGPVLVGC